jgi:hypothetical protein
LVESERESLVTSEAIDHFTTVSPAAAASGDANRETSGTTRSNWPLTVLLVAAVGCVGMLIWFGTRPESADAVFKRIERAGKAGRLTDVEWSRSTS